MKFSTDKVLAESSDSTPIKLTAVQIEVNRINENNEQPKQTVMTFSQFLNEKAKNQNQTHTEKCDLEKERENVKRKPTPDHMKGTDHVYKPHPNKDADRKKHEQERTLK